MLKHTCCYVHTPDVGMDEARVATAEIQRVPDVTTATEQTRPPTVTHVYRI